MLPSMICDTNNFDIKTKFSSAGRAEENASYAENASSFATKQILGYFWPLHLLKKHGKQVPKKVQTINHQGKQVKGQTLDEWVIGF